MQPDDLLRSKLLSQLPDPAELGAYRAATTAAVAKNTQRITRERRLVTLFWIFCAVSATVYLWFDGAASNLPRGPFLAILFFLWGGVEMLKHYINASRIDLLKEIKQVQLQVLEMQAKSFGA